ncbi:hypothetical protein HYFRA_00000761 [Hymenoscyphus fraxineus]|uniref:Ubiquitin interaction domain-containing protein n=1 Tax=Hymenoscyphus fraxineus TaxID=746836 RepID=A0A9N9PQF5_9HELO|nr:hypothetical protein HYFRA_00000761 [Hymenoscyphus fraxineus]
MGTYAQPTQDAIDSFCSMIPGVPRSEVVARLKNNNCNVEQAIGEYFDNIDNPNGNQYRWDEGQFGGERDGGPNNHGVSFDIQGPDDVGPYNTLDGAMSRPPSRISNNRSPMSKVIDLSADAAAADPRNSKTWTSGDHDLEQAIAASKADMALAPQETGITKMDQPHFGPANRGEYEEGKWDMVPVGKSYAQEILIDPEPAFRKREYGSPAFLKPTIDTHPLAALFTIYHSIPKIREVFLDRLNTLPSYGFDKEWWAGSIIEVPTIVDDDAEPEPQVNREIQRLMAFLDKTERSYGSIQALACLPEVQENRRYHNKPIEHAVLESWKNSLRDRENRAVVKKVFSRGVSSEGCPEDEGKDFAVLELELPTNDSLETSFYDLADETIWPDLQPLNLDQSPFLSHVADVVVFKIQGDERKRSVDIPATWYPDRYLRSGKEAALEMRLKKKEMMEQLDRINYLEDRLTNFQMRSGKVVKVKDLFNASLQHDEAVIENGDKLLDTDMDMLSPPRSRKSANLSAELRRLVESIDKKLSALNLEREKAREALTDLSKLYTAPSSDNTAPKLHPYSLRGVSTTNSTMYICERAEPDLMDMDLNSSQTSSNTDQWWQIRYSTSGIASWDQSGATAASGSPGINPVTVEKTTEENVLEAAKNESKNTILVYASESAMEHTNYPLPSALDAFVRADNRAFKAEFVDIEESSIHVSSPGKRKFDEQSSDSQDSTSGRWSGPGPNRESSAGILEREMMGNSEMSYDDAHSASRSLADRLTEDIDDSDSHATGDIIVGMDPSMLQNGTPPGQEMQERGNMRLSLIGSRSNNIKSSTIDNMDLNDIVEDSHVAEESGAVKRVGFAK